MASWLRRSLGLEADESPAEQLNDIPDEMRAIVLAGGAVERLAGATGEYGLQWCNPIPVNGPIGELKYINRLICECGKLQIAHRLGTVDAPGVRGKVDVYEVVGAELVHWRLLFFHCYHPRRSRAVPTGYTLGAFHPQFSRTTIGLATNETCDTFPVGLLAIARGSFGDTLGRAVASKVGYKLISRELSDPKVARPPWHLQSIKSLVQTLLFTGYIPVSALGGGEGWVRVERGGKEPLGENSEELSGEAGGNTGDGDPWVDFRGLANTKPVLQRKAQAFAPSVLVAAELISQNVDDNRGRVLDAGRLFAESLVLALHVCDRIAFQELSKEGRTWFMDALFVATVERRLATQVVSDASLRRADAYIDLYHTRSEEYGGLDVFPSRDRAGQLRPSQTVTWKFAEICCTAGDLASQMSTHLVVAGTLLSFLENFEITGLLRGE